jgi:dihydroxyacid dehydratase/phosphogluconate dehydratase
MTECIVLLKTALPKSKPYGPSGKMKDPMKLNSYTITQGRDRAPARSYLKAIGFTDADLKKPIIGIANTWTETMNCNYNLRELAVKVKEGVRKALPWNSIPSRSATASPWEPRG